LNTTGLTDVLKDLAGHVDLRSIRLKGVMTTGQALYDLTLGNVSATEYTDSASGATLTFNYQQLNLTTRTVNPDGSLASQSFGFDLTTGVQ
jgi:hypothetical protein